MQNADYFIKNKIRLSILQAEYNKNNKEKILQNRVNNKSKLSEYNKQYAKKRYAEDVNFKLRRRLRDRLNKAIKNHQKSGSAVSDLGCTIDELKQYLESKFETGMTWNNYGKWEIDHIEPLCAFDLSIRSNFLMACKYTNLQPIWKEKHIMKTKKDLLKSRGVLCQ